MCCYYDPTARDEDPEHQREAEETYLEENRSAMCGLIQTLSKPVIHYKILAAGRNDPEEAFAYCARYLRPQDAVCIGIFKKDDPAMFARDVALFLSAAQTSKNRSGPADRTYTSVSPDLPGRISSK